MTRNKTLLAVALSPFAFALASCEASAGGDSSVAPQSTSSAQGVAAAIDETVGPFAITDMGRFDEPWAADFIPGTSMLFITEKAGTAKIVDTATREMITVDGLPEIDYGGQGGLGDVAFLASESAPTMDRRTIYLTWAEAGDGDTRGAALGRGMLVCEEADACSVEGLNVIWRQTPKVTGRGHYSHRITFSPDGEYLVLASGDRQKKSPAQDLSNNLGAILRLNLDGSPAAGNPFADQGSPSDEIWSYGHRNTLGIDFDPNGQLWNLEHGPAGGDELNLIEPGRNYGWPLVSDGDNYDGTPIPDNDARPDLAGPVVNWTPVIAPGDFLFYTGDMFPAWKGDALIANLKTMSIVRVAMGGIDSRTGREANRWDLGERLREIVQGPDGALYVLEDGENARLRKLTPAN